MTQNTATNARPAETTVFRALATLEGTLTHAPFG